MIAITTRGVLAPPPTWPCPHHSKDSTADLNEKCEILDQCVDLSMWLFPGQAPGLFADTVKCETKHQSRFFLASKSDKK